MASSENLLTHDEIWDDSALVNAWDEALQEYKKYHSIEVTREDKLKILSEAENAEEAAMRDAPASNQVQEEGDNIIDTSYQASIEDGEMEYVEETVETEAQVTAPQALALEFDNLAKQEGDREQLQASNLDSGSTNHKQPPVENLGDQSAPSVPSQTRNSLPPPPPFPQNFPGDVKDNEALRNLMMSWYFAGYYTGFYEGQQQAHGNQYA